MGSRYPGPQQTGPLPGQWQHGVFGCFDNMSVCIITFFCPCVTFGKNAEALGESCLLCGLMNFCCPAVWLAANTAFRMKIREQQGIEGNMVSDILCLVCCSYCVICQEAQEIEYMRAMQAGGGGYPGPGGYPAPMEMRRH